MGLEVAVIDTGVANTASILAVLKRTGATPFLTTDPNVVSSAEKVILPGVGAFGAAVDFLNGKGLFAPLKERIASNKPTLCVCLGFQLLAESSEESPGYTGLGVLPVSVVRLPADVRVPQQGWNKVSADPRCKILQSGFAYFSNSFCFRSTPAGWHSCETQHGIPFVSAVERGNIVATQFHPELSGTLGHGIIKRWLAANNAVTILSTPSNLCRRVIPCLDVADGRVVKGVKFQELRDAGDPVEQAVRYEAQGADELVMLDISATPEGRSTTLDVVRRLRDHISMPLTVGGGVRATDDAGRLLGAGADKVAVNTAAVQNPELISDLAKRFGAQCTVLAIDAVRSGPGKWEVVVKSGKERTGLDVVEWAKQGVSRGAGEILLTSFDQDGTRAGYDCALLTAVSSAVPVPVIASGGASNASHLREALEAGADAVLAASIFHYNDTTVEELKSELVKAKFPVRTSGYFGSDRASEKFLAASNYQTFIPTVAVLEGRAAGFTHNGVEITDISEALRILSVAGEVAIAVNDDSHSTRGAVFSALKIAPCRVYCMYSDYAKTYLDAGATTILVRYPKLSNWSELPRERLCAVLDVARGEDGAWFYSGSPVAAVITDMSRQFGSVLINFDREPIDLPALRRWASACDPAFHIGVTSQLAGPADIAACDRICVQPYLNYSTVNETVLADAFTAPLTTDRPDGLWPTIVVDETNHVLGLAYSSVASLREALTTRRGVYQSRTRGLWRKGDTSGAHQDLLSIRADCDRDCLAFVVRQHGSGFCHRNCYSCFGPASGLPALLKTLYDRRTSAPEGSYTRKLYTDAQLLTSKLIEEAIELSEAVAPDHIAEEAADLLYFTFVACAKAGVTLSSVERVLNARSLKISRRTGNPKRGSVANRLEKMASSLRSWDRPLAPSTLSAPRDTPIVGLRLVLASDIPPLHRDPVDPAARTVAEAILNDVKLQGATALMNHAVRLGDIKEGEKLVLLPGDLRAAFDALSTPVQEMLLRTAARIRAFAELQKASVNDAATMAILGGAAGQTVAPVEVAGCYAPGGRYPLPSSVLMGAVTARVAGVKTVWVASPRPHPIVLAAAHVAGVDGLLAAGGAQAIAAFTYGAGQVPVCDAIVGPGNKFVTAAKSLIAGSVAIDMLAGPSECLVVADDTANAAVVAADLLAQAEHDVAARAILVSTSLELINKVNEELKLQLATLPTADTAKVAIERNSFAVHVTTLAAAADIANRLAPEHLELHVIDAEASSNLFHHYGALFVGHHAAEVLGDYGAGPNHTLPTGGTARSYGGLSVHTFRRLRTWLRIDDLEAARPLVTDVQTLAECEGLHGHARAAARRLSLPASGSH